MTSLPDEIVDELTELRTEKARRNDWVCGHCGAVPTCFGEYESCDGRGAGYACDECCGHGNEDGWCEPAARDKPCAPSPVPSVEVNRLLEHDPRVVEWGLSSGVPPEWVAAAALDIFFATDVNDQVIAVEAVAFGTARVPLSTRSDWRKMNVK